MRLRLLVVLCLLAVGCQTRRETCGPDTCSGCCDEAGQCQEGNSADVCGGGGAACGVCDAPRVCRNGFCGNADLGGGDAGELCSVHCAGCCMPDQTCIEPPDTVAACGKPGRMCAVCRSTQQCLEASCRDPNCAGCIGLDGGCLEGDDPTACGRQGLSCGACGAGACENGRCSCAQGCRSASGACEAGTSVTSCGTGGAACRACRSGTVCTQGKCVAPPVDGGCAGPNEACGASTPCCGGSCVGSVCTVPDAGAAPGDTCDRPRVLAFNASGVAAASGATTGFGADSASGACNSSGPDVVYTFTTLTPASFSAELNAAAAPYAPTLYLRTLSCAGGAEFDCGAGNAGGSAVLGPVSLPPGSHYLFIDGAHGTEGTWALTAQLSTGTLATGDSCADPRPLSVNAPGSTSIADTTVGAGNDTTSCSGGGADRVFLLETTGTRTLTATVSAAGGPLRPSLSVKATCGASTTLSCATAGAPGGSASVTVPNLAAGSYYLWVDTAGASAGPFTLDVSLQ